MPCNGRLYVDYEGINQFYFFKGRDRVEKIRKVRTQTNKRKLYEYYRMSDNVYVYFIMIIFL